MNTINVVLGCRHDPEDYESDIMFFYHLIVELITDNFKWFVNERRVSFGSYLWEDNLHAWIVPVEVWGLSKDVADNIKECIKCDPSIKCRLKSIMINWIYVKEKSDES